MTSRRAPTAFWLLGVVLILVRARDSIDVTGDGPGYLTRAASVRSGDWALTRVPQAPLHFDIGYPALLATFDIIFTPTAGALVVNLLCLWALVTGAVRLYDLLDGDQGWPRLGVVALASVSTGAVIMGSHVLSDLPFAAVAMWLAVAFTHLRERWTPTWAMVFAGLGSGLVLLRYAGVFMVGGFVVVLTVEQVRRHTWPKAPILGLIALLPTAVWYAWASGLISGNPTNHGSGWNSIAPWSTAVNSTAALGSWFLGLNMYRNGDFAAPSQAALLIRPAAVGLAVAACWVAYQAPKARPTLIAATIYGISMLVWRATIGEHVLLRYWSVVPLLVVIGVALKRSPLLWVICGLNALGAIGYALSG